MDRYGPHLVLQTLTLAMDQRKDVIVAALNDVFAPQSIVERNDAPIRKAEGLELQTGVLHGEAPAPFPIEVGGLQYTCDPVAKMGARISDMRLHGKPIVASKNYKVAGWAPVAEEAKALPGVRPVWDVVEAWLAAQGGRVGPRALNVPRLVGLRGNPGLA